MAKATYDEVVNTLKSKNSTCSEIDKMLTGLGFLVTRKHSGNHHTYVHPQLSVAGFYGSSYDCGHGADPVPLPVYFMNIRKVLRTYETELRILNP